MADGPFRRFPLVEFTGEQIEALLSPLLEACGIRAIEPVAGGLTNTILRVSQKGQERTFMVRIFGGGLVPWDKERGLLNKIRTVLPVPRVLLADEGHSTLPYPSLVCEWIEGVSLRSVRLSAPPERLFSLAEPLGSLLASVSGIALPDAIDRQRGDEAPPSSLEQLLALNDERLADGRARTRLGKGLADALRD